MNHWPTVFLTALAGLLACGCAQQAPTISHVHLGHAITGWPDTPGQQGLFVTAEEKGRSALQHALEANQPGKSPDQIQASIRWVVLDVDSGAADRRAGDRFGLRQALQGAIDHVGFAAEVDDASRNVKASAPRVVDNAGAVLARCDSIVAFGKEAMASSNPQEVKVLATEILRMALANVDGVDVDGDGVVGSKREEYGLKQLRRELIAMTERENPPYTTVATWYLFNLIRLPSGLWVFKEGAPRSPGQYGARY